MKISSSNIIVLFCNNLINHVHLLFFTIEVLNTKFEFWSFLSLCYYENEVLLVSGAAKILFWERCQNLTINRDTKYLRNMRKIEEERKQMWIWGCSPYPWLRQYPFQNEKEVFNKFWAWKWMALVQTYFFN